MMRFFGQCGIAVLLCSLSACIPPARDYSWPKYDAPANAAPDTVDTLPYETEINENIVGQTASWDEQYIRPNAATVISGEYIVQPGDTLRGISNKTGAGSQVIAMKNGLTEPYIIKAGQRLTITGGRYHTVNSGETGIAIARAYGLAWGDVVTLNGLQEPYILRVGQKLLLPARAPQNNANMTMEQRAAAFSLDIDDLLTGNQPALANNEEPAAPSEWRQAIAPVKAVAIPANFSGRFNWPVSGKLISSFGSKGGGKVNDGLNIAVPEGTPIQSAADGVVAYAGNEIGVFGGLILINHGDGWVTAYGHTSKLNVTRGQKVKMGDVIGLAGESGYVQEPQVHFEIRKNRKPVDPIGELPKRS